MTIIGNKLDLEHLRCVSREMATELANVSKSIWFLAVAVRCAMLEEPLIKVWAAVLTTLRSYRLIYMALLLSDFKESIKTPRLCRSFAIQYDNHVDANIEIS